MQRELIESGRVAWLHVPFLLGFDRGDDATNAAECAADQGAFWEMHDLLFEGQRDWARGRGHHEVLRGYAEAIGLDRADFEACYDDEQGEDRTERANRAARRAGVRGTPTFFIDGVPALGAIDIETMLQLVEEAEEAASDR